VIKSKESRPKSPRADEIDAGENQDFFRPMEEILSLASNPQFLVGDCRGLPQAVDLAKVQKTEANLLFMEVYHTIGAQLRASTFLKDVEVVTIFLSPVGMQDIVDLRQAGVLLEDHLANVMLAKQLARVRYQRKSPDANTIKDAVDRARDTLSELKTGLLRGQFETRTLAKPVATMHKIPNPKETAESFHSRTADRTFLSESGLRLSSSLAIQAALNILHKPAPHANRLNTTGTTRQRVSRWRCLQPSMKPVRWSAGPRTPARILSSRSAH
jgi:hypothetical protein